MAIGTTNATAHTSGLTRRQRYEQTRASLETERSSFMPHWRELAEYLAPRRTRYTVGSDINRGDKRSHSIIDSSPRFALRTLQSGMHAGLTSPARPWMKLTTPDPDLADMEDVKQWLHTVTQRMLTLFLRSNVYNVLPILYGDLAAFGTGAIAILEDEIDLIRCYSFPVGSFSLGLDARLLPAVFTHEYTLTVRQVVEQFGRTAGTRDIDWTKFSTHVRSQWDAANYQAPVHVCWYIGPNDEYDPRRLEAKHAMKYRSCHYETGRGDHDWANEQEGALRESGFAEFPIMVPRWDVTGEDTYGTDCPGMTVLGDVKQLQLMQKRKAQAIEKYVNPPMMGPANLRSQKVSSLPGELTYVDIREGQQGLKPIYEVNLQGLQYLIQDMGETRDRIRRGFYEDLFLMLAQSDQVQPVTAAEIHARQEEKLIALGPVLERTNDELLDPAVDRVFAMMVRVGAIPEPPEALQGMPLKVEYLSIMAQAQKLVGVTGQDRLVQSALGMVEAFPEVRHKVNTFHIMDRYADMLGVDPKIVRSDKDALALQQAEQQAMQEAQKAEQMKTEAQAAQALGNTPMQGDTALNALVQQGGVAGTGAAGPGAAPPV